MVKGSTEHLNYVGYQTAVNCCGASNVLSFDMLLPTLYLSRNGPFGADLSSTVDLPCRCTQNGQRDSQFLSHVSAVVLGVR